MRIVSFFFFFIFFLDYGKVSFMIASFTFSVSRTKGSFGSVTFVSRNFKIGAILACRGVIDKSKIASSRSWMASDRGTTLYRTGARNWRSFRPSLFTSSFSFRLLFGAKKEFVFTRRFTDECFPIESCDIFSSSPSSSSSSGIAGCALTLLLPPPLASLSRPPDDLE